MPLIDYFVIKLALNAFRYPQPSPGLADYGSSPNTFLESELFLRSQILHPCMTKTSQEDLRLMKLFQIPLSSAFQVCPGLHSHHPGAERRQPLDV